MENLKIFHRGRIKLLQIIRAHTIALLCLMFFLTFSDIEKVKAQTIEYSITANFIYQFTKYFDWPDESNNTDFVIGIIGDPQLADYLLHVTVAKRVGIRKIKVIEYSGTENSINCNILYVSPENSKCLKLLVLHNETNPFLIVTQYAGMAYKGSCINLTVVDNKVKMEINTSNIQKRNLKVASDFLNLGLVIE